MLAACATRDVPVMSWEEYARLSTSWPYVLQIDSRLYYFGARHTYDPADPQLAQIERAWSEFRPDIAFTEGGSPPLEATREEAVRKHGETGFVRFLAARDDVPVTTLDPSRAEEVAALSSKFSKEQIKLFFILRGASQFIAREGVEKVDAEIERVLRIYNASPGLGGSPRTLAEVASAYSRSFPGRYTDVRGEWFDPVRRDTFLNEIARAGSDYRDRFVVAKLLAHVRDGRRVFAVIGGSHVMMQERALRAGAGRGGIR